MLDGSQRPVEDLYVIPDFGIVRACTQAKASIPVKPVFISSRDFLGCLPCTAEMGSNIRLRDLLKA